jgi:hypothetical protein
VCQLTFSRRIWPQGNCKTQNVCCRADTGPLTGLTGYKCVEETLGYPGTAGVLTDPVPLYKGMLGTAEQVEQPSSLGYIAEGTGALFRPCSATLHHMLQETRHAMSTLGSSDEPAPPPDNVWALPCVTCPNTGMPPPLLPCSCHGNSLRVWCHATGCPCRHFIPSALHVHVYVHVCAPFYVRFSYPSWVVSELGLASPRGSPHVDGVCPMSLVWLELLQLMKGRSGVAQLQQLTYLKCYPKSYCTSDQTFLRKVGLSFAELFWLC